jgi:hypothetical protein
MSATVKSHANADWMRLGRRREASNQPGRALRCRAANGVVQKSSGTNRSVFAMWDEEDGSLWDRVIGVIGIDCTCCDLVDLVGNPSEFFGLKIQVFTGRRRNAQICLETVNG